MTTSRAHELDLRPPLSTAPGARTAWGWLLGSLSLALAATAMLLLAPAAQAAGPAGGGSGLDASWVYIGAALATGLSSLGAGFAVAKVGVAAVGALAETPELFGRLLIFIGLAEGIAIYGLIVSILMLNKIA